MNLFTSLLLSCGSIYLPPHEFDHEPVVPVMIEEMPVEQIQTICAPQDGNAEWGRVESCSQRRGHIWVIRLPNNLGSVREACYLRHEHGHVNGWRWNHPNYRFGYAKEDAVNAFEVEGRPSASLSQPLRHEVQREIR
jgi:hypothetical protein